MKIAIHSYDGQTMRPFERNDRLNDAQVQLVISFGAKHLLEGPHLFEKLRTLYTSADIVLCTTAGEIFGQEVLDDTVSITAIQFEHSTINAVSVDAHHFADSCAAGISLISQLRQTEDLCHILLIADGALVNGSALAQGVNQVTAARVSVSGGLAGDGPHFQSTLVGLNNKPTPGMVVAVGFYSTRLQVNHGSQGGYEMFGPERPLTKTCGNRLYEINGEPALELYKKYLGPYAAGLPGSALLFPLSVKLPGGETIVRTILSIDAGAGSMTFAGDIPQNTQARFMKANVDRLIEAAGQAALEARGPGSATLAILISCVGRKLILNGRVAEEVEEVSEVLGTGTFLTGFYSYGELSPLRESAWCELHNQTMTITTFTEK